MPEVETVRKGLAPVLVGQRIARVEARRADLRFPFPERFTERLLGQKVTRLDRRAKYLIAALSGGDDLVMHLGMTGRFSIVANEAVLTPGVDADDAAADPKHDHVVLHLAGGGQIIYNDPRRFGFMLLIDREERDRHALFRNLGVEPNGPELTAAYLASRARGRKVNLKAFLMDQHVVAGLGNIYVSEALHRARLSPERLALSLGDKQGRPTERAERLVPAIASVIGEAIVAGGSTISDYRRADGSSGGFQDRFAVYDREGFPCQTRGCGGTIRRVVHSNRATYYCPRCQR